MALIRISRGTIIDGDLINTIYKGGPYGAMVYITLNSGVFYRANSFGCNDGMGGHFAAQTFIELLWAAISDKKPSVLSKTHWPEYVRRYGENESD